MQQFRHLGLKWLSFNGGINGCHVGYSIEERKTSI
jgi:hypothetical protein